ncbi:hypothetical protein CN451_08210 [Priestia megaterium]|uniref:TniQ family protein n=1 Tax=Priestia megaterium TaxID=1404 RepID=UPI000BF74792|nr:TniQ family protein [Priestia megaterium]PEX11644.1 hypothetical protein CN451_08210 [Priestia megaterium]
MKSLEVIIDEEKEIFVHGRSYYYTLQPLGIGTLYVESLTSYVRRLSLHHNVRIQHLLNDIMKSYQNDKSVVKCHYKYGINLNGNSYTVKCLVEALSQKVCNSQMRFLTLLHLKNKPIHAGMKRTEVWCTECYREMQLNHEELYEPLIWYLIYIEVCPKHNTPLVECCYCSKCKSDKKIKRGLHNIYCVDCNSKLDLVQTKKLDVNDERLKYQQFILKKVEELIVIPQSLYINKLL